MTMPIDINGIASWWRVVCFPVAAACILLAVSGCDQIEQLNECDGEAPAAPLATALEIPGVNTGRIEGFGVNVEFSNVFIDYENTGGRHFVRFRDASLGNRSASIGRIDIEDVSENDIVFVVTGYTIDGASHPGSGNVRITRSDNDVLAGVFAACVRLRGDLTLNVRGPWRLIRGAFHVTL